jgi:hypothetical protein
MTGHFKERSRSWVARDPKGTQVVLCPLCKEWVLMKRDSWHLEEQHSDLSSEARRALSEELWRLMQEGKS